MRVGCFTQEFFFCSQKCSKTSLQHNMIPNTARKISNRITREGSTVKLTDVTVRQGHVSGETLWTRNKKFRISHFRRSR
eukprot:g51587.t1